MGLIYNLIKMSFLKDMFDIDNKEDQFVIVLVGNLNIGKSIVFNYFIGFRQYIGNWLGKIVVIVCGNFKYKNIEYVLIDLLGIYFLFVLL